MFTLNLKSLILMLVTLPIIGMSTVCYSQNLSSEAALDGGANGGGGSDEAEVFQKVARDVSTLLANDRATYKYGMQLLETLNNPIEIIISDSLAGACDGKAVGTTYWAYSCPHRINLLASEWANPPLGKGRLRNELYAQASITKIIHEVFRAGNRLSIYFISDDGGNAITMGSALGPILKKIEDRAKARINTIRNRAKTIKSRSAETTTNDTKHPEGEKAIANLAEFISITYKYEKKDVKTNGKAVLVEYTWPRISSDSYNFYKITHNQYNANNFCKIVAKENNLNTMQALSFEVSGSFLSNSRTITSYLENNVIYYVMTITGSPANRTNSIETITCAGNR